MHFLGKLKRPGVGLQIQMLRVGSLGRMGIQDGRDSEFSSYYAGDYMDTRPEYLNSSQQEFISAMVATATPLGEDVTLYRGINESPVQRQKYVVGEPLDLDMPTSTSTSLEVAHGFSYDRTIMEIRNTSGLSVLTENELQAEVVVMPGVQFKVIDVYEVPGLVKSWVVVEPTQEVVNKMLVKAPPGPPPRPGLEWREETHRWVRPSVAGTPPKTSEFRVRTFSLLWWN